MALVPSIDLHAIETGHAVVADWIPWRELLLLGAAAMSMATTTREVRYGDNEFTWAPIAEVAALFIGIFLTMIPALEYLGEKAPHLPLNEITFFLFSGGLSSVLDNAPTYAAFYEMAAQLPPPDGSAMVGTTPPVPEVYLVSIALGSVFCGALTYIGNGPNFMVKSVAESRGVLMPSFGGYMIWSYGYLGPILLAMMCFFIAEGPLWTVLGAVAVLFVLGRAGRDLRESSRAARDGERGGSSVATGTKL